MDTLGARLKKLREQNGFTLEYVASKVGTTKVSISRYEKNEREPKGEMLNLLANFFNVTVDYLLGRTDIPTPDTNSLTLNKKDERDIEKALSSTLEQLENVQEGLMFDGEILDDETRELLIASLERSMRLAKKIAKDKYTPNKYKKDK